MELLRIIAVLFIIITASFVENECHPYREFDPNKMYGDVSDTKKDAFQLNRQGYPKFLDMADRQYLNRRREKAIQPETTLPPPDCIGLACFMHQYKDARPSLNRRREEEVKAIQPETTLPPPDCIGLACFMHQYKDARPNLNRRREDLLQNIAEAKNRRLKDMPFKRRD